MMAFWKDLRYTPTQLALCSIKFLSRKVPFKMRYIYIYIESPLSLKVLHKYSSCTSTRGIYPALGKALRKPYK